MRKRAKTAGLTHTEYLYHVLSWKDWERHHRRLIGAIRSILLENEALKQKVDELEKEKRC